MLDIALGDFNSSTAEATAHLFLFFLSAEPGQQKSFKRKRSLINWPFWRGSNTQLDGQPLSPTSLSPTQGRLFGRPLSSICSPDHGLPKPVMVSLSGGHVHQQEGSGPCLERGGGGGGGHRMILGANSVYSSWGRGDSLARGSRLIFRLYIFWSFCLIYCSSITIVIILSLMRLITCSY